MEFVKITSEQKRQFDEEGYLIMRGALDSETVSSLIEAGDRLVASDRVLNRQRRPGGLYDGFRNCVSMDDAFLPLDHQPEGLRNRGTVTQPLSVAAYEPLDLPLIPIRRGRPIPGVCRAGTAIIICPCATWETNISRVIRSRSLIISPT